tara:strand:+ start:728 stop:988 length:261 start_codon:yes stop_codon:yes gene_type:complete
MSVYNRTKADSRKQERADRTAEIAAIDSGSWPRDIDDRHRWGVGQTFYSNADHAAYARQQCVSVIDYLDGIPARIASGELGNGWQA